MVLIETRSHVYTLVPPLRSANTLIQGIRRKPDIAYQSFDDRTVAVKASCRSCFFVVDEDLSSERLEQRRAR